MRRLWHVALCVGAGTSPRDGQSQQSDAQRLHLGLLKVEMIAFVACCAVSSYDFDHMEPDISAFSPDSLAARLLATLHQSRVARHRVSRGAAVFRQGDPAIAVFL